MTGVLPEGYDAFLLANIIHYYSPEENRSLLQRVRMTRRCHPPSTRISSPVLSSSTSSVFRSREPLLEVPAEGIHEHTGSVKQLPAWVDDPESR